MIKGSLKELSVSLLVNKCLVVKILLDSLLLYYMKDNNYGN